MKVLNNEVFSIFMTENFWVPLFFDQFILKYFNWLNGMVRALTSKKYMLDIFQQYILLSKRKWASVGFHLLRASSFVPLFRGSKTPVCKLILETGFFNKFSPTLTRFCRFSSVATSTEAKSPVNVSSCIRDGQEKSLTNGRRLKTSSKRFSHFNIR